MDAGEHRPRGETVTSLPSHADASCSAFVLPARWRAERLLGSGGQAEVWLAFDSRVEEWVAVKVFHPALSQTARERLRREIRLGRSLSHPNLVKIYELVELDERLGLAMEHLEGGSAAQRVEQGPLSVDEVVRIAEGVLAALEHLHDRNIVHRDVKPSNILFDAAGQVRLADLGLARSVDDDSKVTRTAMAVGTPAYMSPEQIRGQVPGPASDLYCLGVTLFQLITGALPFEGSTEYETATQHLSALPPAPRSLRGDCPRWLDRFVLRLLEKRPGNRWSHAGEARQALLSRRVGPSRRLRRTVAGVAAAVAAASALWLMGEALAARKGKASEAAEVEAAGSVVRGLDRSGAVAWEVALHGKVSDLRQADLDGDGERECVASTSWPQLAGGLGPPPEIAILDGDGDVLSRIDPAQVIRDWPFEYSRRFNAQLSLDDLDGDGLPEVIANCRHPDFFPAGILVYWSSRRVWEPILLHQGHLYDVVRVPGSTPPRLLFVGVDNRLGMLPVAGEIVATPPAPEDRNPARTINLMAGGFWESSTGVEPVWYTLIDREGGTARLAAVREDGSLLVKVEDDELTLDPFGNLAGGPNAGRDLRAARLDFLRRLWRVSRGAQPPNGDGVRKAYTDLARSAGPLLRERPYRAALDVAAARAMARVGELRQGVAVLRRCYEQTSYDDVAFRLAQLEALGGDLAAARRCVEELATRRKTPRAYYDAAHLALRLCIEARDRTGLTTALAPLTAPFEPEQSGLLAAALRARVDVWWDSVTDLDCSAASEAFAPAGKAMAVLARWRLGRTRESDVADMAALAERSPDARYEAELARGAALLGSGRAAEAAVTLGRLVARLEPLSADDFMNRQILDLARAIELRAAAVGDRREALARAAFLRPHLRDGLLPAILVDELLKP